MKATPLEIKDVLLIEPTVFEDERGFFFESFNQREFNRLVGRSIDFVQDNHSWSKKNVIRGLHYQVKYPQAKLVRVVAGEIYDVAVDVRKSSPSFGHWVARVLSENNKNMMWIPEGFAHGFAVLSEYAEVLYKTNQYYIPDLEGNIAWNDSTLDIHWPLNEHPLLSPKDAEGKLLNEAEKFE